MSLVKKLIATSALVSATGCTRTIFDGHNLYLEENTSVSRLTVTQSIFGNYTMTLSGVSNLQNLNGQSGSCTYLIKAQPDSKVTFASKRCEGTVKIENSQEIFNKYMNFFIKEPIRR